MKQFLAIFNKVGGMEILRQYWRGHVLLFALVQTVLLGFRKKSLEIVRLAVNNRVLCKLRKKNRKFVAAYEAPQLPRIRSKKVWICWLQGMENAPELVQRCYRSLRENLPDRDAVVLTEENYKDYVNFPEHICRKIESGVITRTHFSDLLRLELLLNHGGTWIDATVFCSGGQIPGYMLDSDLFMFQKLKPGLDGSATCISSWFITACTNHPILALTRDLLYRYWEKHNSLVDYFLIHDCFQLAIEKYPQLWKAVVPFPNSVPHILLLRLFEPYDSDMWDAVRNQTPFHKLTYKFKAEQTHKPDTYYSRLFAREDE